MKRKIRFIFVSNNTFSGNNLSGGDRIWTELIRYWSKKHKVKLFGSQGAVDMAKNNGLEVTNPIISAGVINISNPKTLLNPLFLFGYILIRTSQSLFATIKNYQKIKGYQYIYSVSDFYPDFVPALVIKLFKPKIKWIAGYYLFAPKPTAKNSPYKGMDSIKGFFYWLMQMPSYFLVRRFADFVFVTSEPDAAKFITPKRSKEKIITVQGGVDMKPVEKYFDKKSLLPVVDRKYDACFLGRFHQQKGVLELIEIWKEVVKIRPKSKLIMVGNGGLKQEVRKKIKKLRLGNCILLRGFLDGEKKFKVFRQSKIMVHPATYDSGGMSAAEGMAWGLPAVSYDLEALKTYYPKGMIKTPIGKKLTFARNVVKLINNKDLYTKTSKEATNLIREKWNWKNRSAIILRSIIR